LVQDAVAAANVLLCDVIGGMCIALQLRQCRCRSTCYVLSQRYQFGAALYTHLQVEGAFVMGLGVMLSEDVEVHPTTGKLLSGTTWKYKIPNYDLIPQQFDVRFLSEAPNPRGILSSKASGEPALMASTSALMALQAAAGAAASEVAGLSQVAQQQQQQQEGIGSRASGVADFCTGGGSGRAAGWCVLSAPATPQKLKAAVGSFSVADALEAALAACSGHLDAVA
jgi:hypothetical protein